MAVPQEVQDEVDLEYGQKQEELNRALATLKQSLASTQQTQQNYGAVGDQSLQNIYNQLAQQLQGVRGQTHDLYEGSKGYLDKLFGGAKADSQAASHGAVGDVQSMAARLGLQGALPDALTKLQGQAQRSNAALNQSGAESLANLNELGTGQEGVALQAVGNAYTSGAMSRKELINQVLANITGAQKNESAGEGDILSQLQSLQNEKGLALKVGSERSAQRKEEMDLQLKLAAMSGSGGGGSSNPLGDMLKMLDIEKKQNDLARFGTGREGLAKWKAEHLSTKGKAVSSKLSSYIDAIIQRSSELGTSNKGDPFDRAIYILKQSPKKGVHSVWAHLDKNQRDAMVKALQIYYGK